MDRINNKAQYNQVTASIEKLIAKATETGGFIGLSDAEKDELTRLSRMVEQYEDDVLKIMPLPSSNN